jgi:hypothetical protein
MHSIITGLGIIVLVVGILPVAILCYGVGFGCLLALGTALTVFGIAGIISGEHTARQIGA